MSVTKFTRSFYLPPTLLRREQLDELEKVVTRGFSDAEAAHLEITATVGEVSFSAHSIQDLLALELPRTTDKLSLRASGSERYVDVRMYCNHINCYLISDDEKWFLGTMEQMRRFFRKRRPWYWWLSSHGGWLAGAIIGAAVVVPPLLGQSLLWGVGPVAIALLFSVGVMTGKIFPYVRVEFAPRSSRPFPFEVIQIILAVLGVVVSLGFGIAAIVLPPP